MRPFIFLVVAFSSVCALSLNNHWEEKDTKWLSLVLEGVLKKKLDNIASLHYAASGLKLLNVKPSDAAAKEACEVAKKADLSKLDVLYNAAALSADLPDCSLTNTKEAQKTIESVLAESNPSGERITQALRAADRLNIKVNQAAFDKILTAAMKDDSAANLAWIFNAAALLDKGTGAKYFDKIKNLVSQADEVDKKFLQFDGGLTITAIAIHGIMSLAEKQGKMPPVSQEQILLFSNYLLSRKHVSTEKSAFHLLSALGVLVNNHQLVPVAISLVGPVMIERLDYIKISVANVFGLPIEATNVRVDIIPEGADYSVMGNLRMTQLESDRRIWVFGPDKLPDNPGFHTLDVKIESKDKRLVGLTGSSVLIKNCENVIIEDFKLGVLEKDDAVTGASLSSVVQFSKFGKVLQADNTKRVYISFSIKPHSGAATPIQPHQVFVLFKHSSGAEVFYTADVQTGGKYLLDINLAKAHKDFEGLSGKYTAHLIIGDARIRSPIDWPFADFSLTIPPTQKHVEPKSHRIEYDPKPEIKHVFRQPEKRPPTIVSDAFTVICLAPLLLLLILVGFTNYLEFTNCLTLLNIMQWLRIGMNFGNMPVSIWTLFFHLGLAALFGLYFVFWLRLNMFDTLKYLAGISAFTYLAGNRVLRAIAEKRKWVSPGLMWFLFLWFQGNTKLSEPMTAMQNIITSPSSLISLPVSDLGLFLTRIGLMSLTKNLRSLTSIGPRAVVTWDKAERIRRNEEIWANPNSIVHRLPEHYCKRYWDNLLRDATPVHYRPPTSRLYWDPVRKVEVEAENYPLLVLHPSEADEGLWGGEGVVKGWKESRPYTKKKVLPRDVDFFVCFYRHWVPRLYFPALKNSVLYSEILDKHMTITVTERTMRLIDQHFGLDYYILRTPEIDLASKLGNRLVYVNDEERHNFIRQKYAEFVIPEEEADWIGLDLNEAVRKQQELEERRIPEPLKFKFERDLVARLRAGTDMIANEEEFAPKTEESKFGERLLGKYLDPVAKRFRR
ncbi:ribophorin II [Necator americanus]|uniref:Dolichyl-diphosphooligosaccharide--protein glycosyltransferase subunit 2 n=1 Tax=Necator americanus TaxID=51031 RepID=W2T140_NECAM|nr:ribophorin II [Necator americanus]ETN75720.1 ribophorin II [Necator americanus]